MDKKRLKTKCNAVEKVKTKVPEQVNAVAEEPERMEVDDDDNEHPLETLDDLNKLTIPSLPEPIMNVDGSGARLLITHIVNENFKSYAGRHTLGPFHKNFTAIVGPNGSGKSNVIDSLLFVFGYRAQKIRSKKISVLIHNSDTHPNLTFCTVEIHFVKGVDKNENEYEIVPDSSFFVSRTAHSTGSSTYHINGKTAKFAEVAALLRDNGIDLVHNRFLILQGEVEQIALMKPKALQENDEGMLEYLEDIIGSKRLVTIIDRLNKRCDEINDVRTEKLNRVKAVESEKQDLEGPKAEAVEYLLLENEIIKKKNVLFRVHELEAKENCDEVAKERDTVKEEYQEHQKSLKEIIDKIKSRKETYESAKKKYDECSTKVDKYKQQFSAMEQEDAKLRADLINCKKKSKDLPGQIETENKKLNELKAQPAKAEKQVKEFKENIEQLEAKKPGLAAQLQEATLKLRDATKELQNGKEKAEGELVAYQKNVNEARSKLDIAQSELDICLSALTNETKKFDELKSSLAKVMENIDKNKKTLNDSEEQFEKVKMNFETSQNQLRGVTQEITKLEEDIRTKRSRVDEARSKMQTSHSRNKVLDAIMQQKRDGKIPGIIGRLGDLGAIEEKYDVAISTACGPLDNIVVDTIDTAQTCVEFLKRGNVGTATFLALDKQNHLIDSMRRPFVAPEKSRRLFDLIRVEDENVLPAFYYALRDTLVADNLDEATRIGLQGRVRYRVVTLDGKLVDTSGTMSGGGTQQSRGRMGRKVMVSPTPQMTPDKLRRLDDELTTLKNRLNELRERQRELETSLHASSRESQRLREQIDRCKNELTTLNEQKNLLKKQVATQEDVVKRTVPDKNEEKRLRSKVDTYRADYEKVNAGGSKFQESIDEFDKKIAEVSEKVVGSIRKQLDACNRELDDNRKSLTKTTVSIKSSTRNVSKSEEKIKNLQEELDGYEKKTRTIKERLKKLEDEAMEISSAHDQAIADANAFEERCKDGKKSLDELEEREQELTASGMDHKQRLAHAEKTFKEFHQKLVYWEKEVKKLKLNDLSDLKPLMSDDKAAAANVASDDDEEELMDAACTSDERFENFELVAPSVDELKRIQKEVFTRKLTLDEDRLKSMKPNLAVIAEYRKKVENMNEKRKIICLLFVIF